MKKITHFNNDIISTYIGKGTDFKGTIHTQGSLHIEGNMEGEIHSQGEVFIGESSKVRSNIIAKHIVISGEVIGNVEALKGLEITKRGRLYGNITGDQLTIEEGAIYKGRVNMDVISSQNVYEGHLELVKTA